VDVGAQLALILRTLDQRHQQRRDPVASLVNALLVEVRVVDDLRQAAVALLELQDPFEVEG
jgi:hypothetical protein